MSETLLRTPLYDAHVALNARLVPFAGYEMPVQYASIIAESKAVREGAGMFDVSHMARLILKGDHVQEFLEKVTSNDISKLNPGFGQYSLLPNLTGGCVDDIIVYKISDTHFYMVVNASNHEKDVAWLNEQNTFGVTIEDETDATAMIAVQGPTARELIALTRSRLRKPDSLNLYRQLSPEFHALLLALAIPVKTVLNSYARPITPKHSGMLSSTQVSPPVV
jgi:aminomethyltransferase